MVVLSSEESVETKLERIAKKAQSEANFQFTSLFHLMNMELLRGCFEQLRESAASGIDGITKQEYAEHLEDNLEQLLVRLHQMAYIPQPVVRVYLPKPGSDKMRPLGIPSLEDKLVQAGLAKILRAIYEQDFVDESYGFKPGRGCHDALRALSQTVEGKPVNYIVEADIRGFFDNVDQDQLMTFLEHRIADKRVLRYIKRFLKAGISEDGACRASESGVPQGGVISPILANIYLHYSLDLWVVRKFAKTCQGMAKLIRYADDYVVCFQYEEDAKRFRQEMEARLNQFGLEIAPEKTQCIEFGNYANDRAKARGEKKAATFDFLGFTHYCSRSRNGRKFRMKRKTISKRLTLKLKVYRDWLWKNKERPTAEILKTTARKLIGHYGYYGVTDNIKCINAYYYNVKRILHNGLNRRGKRGCCSWEQFERLLVRFPLPRPKVMVNLF